MRQERVATWLIAYDIADPRRLTRIHTFLKKYGVPVQYSVFLVRLDRRALREVVRGLRDRLRKSEDDVRLYRLPPGCRPELLGRALLPEGILIGDMGLSNFLGGMPDQSGNTIKSGNTGG